MAQLIRFPSTSVTSSPNVNLHDASGTNVTLGQKAMAASLPVVLSSDQSAVPVSAASLPLPAGASTAAKQPALGTAGTASADVITVQGIASMTALKVDGSAVTQPVSAATLPLPTGASTSANQTTGNTSLASIDTKTPSLGQAAMAASSPVVIASNQSAVPVSGTFWQATQPVSIAAAPLAPVNSNGSIVNTTLTTTTASSAAPPANAIGFILEAPSDNTHNIRWCVGSTASASVGMLMEPGRDTGYIPMAATISVCAITSGTNAFSIQWVKSS